MVTKKEFKDLNNNVENLNKEVKNLKTNEKKIKNIFYFDAFGLILLAVSFLVGLITESIIVFMIVSFSAMVAFGIGNGSKFRLNTK